MTEGLRGTSCRAEPDAPEVALRIPGHPAEELAPRISARLQTVLAEARRILLVRLRSLGDAVLMTPVPAVLKAWRPQIQVSVLIEEPLDGIFRRHPQVDEVIAVPPHQTPARRLRSMVRIRRAGFDVVLNLHSGSTAGLYTVLSGAGLRVAYDRARFAFACNVRVAPPRVFWGVERTHTVRHQLSPLLQLGIPVPGEVELVLRLDPAARRRVEQQLAEARLQAGRFVILQPFSKWLTKEWEPARFAALAQRLRQSYGLPVVVLPAPSDLRKLERLLGLDPGMVSLPGRSLEEMMAWIEHCGLFVGTDSGPAHVAAALKKKTVVVAGSADPRVWHPWRTEHQILSAGLPCIPCPGHRCREFETPRCLESIGVEQVLEAVARLTPF